MIEMIEVNDAVFSLGLTQWPGNAAIPGGCRQGWRRSQYAVAEICHGKPTFRGTRILVADVLEKIADGLAWETMIAEWHGTLSHESIAEAVSLS